MTVEIIQPKENKTSKKTYQKPAIVFEQDLEVRAGSPENDFTDMLEINPGD